jgi:two-component system, NtrC family, response regulator AtoC
VLEDQVIRRVGGVRDMQVDVRVLAASNRDLEKAVRESQFRQDLYYRLAIIAIFIPPLRDRKEDILPLVDSLSTATTASSRSPFAGFPTIPAGCCSTTPGPATCASSRTPLSAP